MAGDKTALARQHPTPLDRRMPHSPPQGAAASQKFFGWAVLPSLTYSLFVGAGFIFYAMSVLLEGLVTTHGFSVAEISAANTIFLLVSGLAGIAVGELIARYDVRWTVCVGTGLIALAYWLLPLALSLPQIYAIYVLLGFGYAMTALLPATTVVARWFVRRRALALALTQSGLSLGGIILTPLLARDLAAHGLTALQEPLFLVIILANIPLCVWLMRPDPQSMGQHPDGDKADPAGARAADGMRAATALRSRFFRYAALAAFLALLAQVGTIAHVYNWALTRAGAEQAAGMVALLALASFTGRLVCGAVLDRLDLQRFAVTLYVMQAAILLVMAFIATPFGVALTVLAFGLTVGNILMLQPLLVGAAFGMRDYPRLLGYFQFLMNFGVALGPVMMGVIFDASPEEGYRNAFVAVAVAAFCAALCLLRAGPTWRAAQTPPAREGKR